MTLIHNWKHSWKFLTIQLSAIITAVSAIVMLFPEMQAFIPADWYPKISAGLGLLLIALRLIKQSGDGIVNEEEAE